MRNTIFIIVVAALLCSCGGKRTNKDFSVFNADAKNVGKSECGRSSDNSTDLADTNYAKLCRNLTVIPQDISGNNSANIILDAVTDVDGNSYDAVRIGKQVWLQTDLRTKHYRDGSAIPHQIYVDGKWNDNDFSYTEPFWAEEYTYGELCLYNWSAVADPRGLCPDGWHVATKQDWDKLEAFLGVDSVYVKGKNPKNIAKALSSTQWPDGSENEGYYAAKAYTVGYRPTTTNNATGFSAFPWPYYDGRHYGGMLFAAFWTPDAINKSKAWSVKIYGNGAALHKQPDLKGYFYMVRCVKGE